MEVRRLNLYREGDMHHCNMRMDNCTVGRCFEECLIQSRLSTAKGAVPIPTKFRVIDFIIQPSLP